ncbi:MAG: DNA double-strand break repair nuclease NurA, partial [Candidatus Obscuribacterales bacterium]|nr:DNA double-strand break repair nuclease NurA [Candidatus Obscuribacterales bacterium]
FQQDLLERFSMELDAFNAARLALVGYISHSRSSDIVNNLRIWSCPYPGSRCQLYCAAINEEEFPCSSFWPLSDRQLISSKIPQNSRSNFFLSAARCSAALEARNQVCFAYLNLGQESARLEIPRWLFDDKELLDFSLSALLSQIQKGQGYPVSLAEAHNMAVIRQADRSQFFQVLAHELMLGKKSHISVSPKESKKRRGIV